MEDYCMESISESVGKLGKNRYKDASVVQTLLNSCIHLMGPLRPLSVDGKVGPASVSRIEKFQLLVLKMSKPDGKVDPRGKTIQGLNHKSFAPPKPKATLTFANIGSFLVSKSAISSYHFPLKNRPTKSYKTGMRRFSSNRSKGRLHAGSDLYAAVGTDVYSLCDGVVETPKYSFYLGTYAIEIKHKDFVARYGELGSVESTLTKGASIKKGQKIGTVGELRGLNMSMLHLELYSGDKTGPLTDRGNQPYMRRTDLIDPTPILDEAK
jgi:murein DD-endopeptidase MepM/ murein hydrolase activator NlpD